MSSVSSENTIIRGLKIDEFLDLFSQRILDECLKRGQKNVLFTDISKIFYWSYSINWNRRKIYVCIGQLFDGDFFSLSHTLRNRWLKRNAKLDEVVGLNNNDPITSNVLNRCSLRLICIQRIHRDILFCKHGNRLGCCDGEIPDLNILPREMKLFYFRWQNFLQPRALDHSELNVVIDRFLLYLSSMNNQF